MEEKKTLEDLGKQVGIDPENQGRGRPVGSYGVLPNLKTMTRKDLITELGQKRKKVKDYEEKIQGIKQEAPEASVEIPPQFYGVIPALAYDYLAARYGDHWKLREQEVILYGQAIEKVVNRYLGSIAEQNQELFALAMVAVATTIPRVMKTVTMMNAQPKDPKPATDKASAPKKEPEKKV